MEVPRRAAVVAAQVDREWPAADVLEDEVDQYVLPEEVQFLVELQREADSGRDGRLALVRGRGDGDARQTDVRTRTLLQGRDQGEG
jgi:hypothetical protein